jgi:hypothetical protein
MSHPYIAVRYKKNCNITCGAIDTKYKRETRWNTCHLYVMRESHVLPHSRWIVTICTLVASTSAQILLCLGGALNYNGLLQLGCGFGTDTTYLRGTYYPSSMPAPIVSLYFDSQKSKMVFSVNTKYVAQDNAYVIRFSPFVGSVDDINRPGTCENRLSSTYTNVGFSSWWSHASNALVSNALNGLSYLNYANNNMWTLTALDCANMLYSASFDLNTLKTCTSPQNVKEVSVSSYGNYGITTIKGSLFVSMVAPR